jgi:hypothetical protein
MTSRPKAIQPKSVGPQSFSGNCGSFGICSDAIPGQSG